MRRGEHYLLAHGPRLLGASTRRHKPSAVSRTRRRRATSSRRRAWATGVIFVIFGILVICAAPVARTARHEVAGRPIRCAEMESVPGRRPRLVAETVRMALQDEPETAAGSATASSSTHRLRHGCLRHTGTYLEVIGVASTGAQNAMSICSAPS